MIGRDEPAHARIDNQRLRPIVLVSRNEDGLIQSQGLLNDSRSAPYRIWAIPETTVPPCDFSRRKSLGHKKSRLPYHHFEVDLRRAAGGIGAHITPIEKDALKHLCAHLYQPITRLTYHSLESQISNQDFAQKHNKYRHG